MSIVMRQNHQNIANFGGSIKLQRESPTSVSWVKVPTGRFEGRLSIAFKVTVKKLGKTTNQTIFAVPPSEDEIK
jgi:hypothetical protein